MIDPDEVTDTVMDMWERSWQDRIQTGITEALSDWLDRRAVDVIHALAPRIAGDVTDAIAPHIKHLEEELIDTIATRVAQEVIDAIAAGHLPRAATDV